MIRALLIAFVGIPTCAAVFAGTITYVLSAVLGGEPPATKDWIGVGAFGGVSLVAIFVSVRAFRRVQAGDTSSVAPWLANIVPVLLLVGGVVGSVFMFRIQGDHIERLKERREGYCKSILGGDATPDNMDVCLPHTRICDAQYEAGKKHLSYGSAMRRCLDKQLAAEEMSGRLKRNEPKDEARVKPVYPSVAGEVPPLVSRLCSALHGLPKRRKAECCKTAPGVILTSECERNLAGALEDGAVILSEASVTACETEMTRIHEGCDWVGPYDLPVPRACQGIIVGAKADGAVCRSTLECLAGLLCRGAGPTDTGKCGPPSRVGGLCNTGVDTLSVYTRQGDAPPCQDGYCDRNRCVAKSGTGSSCSANVHCKVGRCAGGVCVDESVAALGEDCLGSDCTEGLRCINKKCIEPKALGATCTNPQECKAACVDGTCQMGCSAAPLLKKL